MLYLFRVARREDIYYLFETRTESIVRGDAYFLTDLIIEHNLRVENVQVEKGSLKIKDWPHSIKPYSTNKAERESKHILLGKVNEQRFKIINFVGGVNYISDENLKQLIENGQVANCSLTGVKDKEYKSIDTYTIKTDPKFSSYINKKYAEFVAKAQLMGMDIKFDYTIENEDVKIQNYTGKSTRIIVPNFITAICGSAFSYKEITEVSLNEGLKYIGNNAFSCNHIKNVNLPATVVLVGQEAFEHNETTKKIFTKTNPNTLILNWSEAENNRRASIG